MKQTDRGRVSLPGPTGSDHVMVLAGFRRPGA